MAYQPGVKSILQNNRSGSGYLGPPVPVGTPNDKPPTTVGGGKPPPGTDPPQGGGGGGTITGMGAPPRPPANPGALDALARWNREQAVYTANPSRRPAPMGYRPDGSINYSPAVYGSNYQGPQGSGPGPLPGVTTPPPRPPAPTPPAPLNSLGAGGTLPASGPLPPSNSPAVKPPQPSPQHVWTDAYGWVLPPPSPGNGNGGGGV